MNSTAYHHETLGALENSHKHLGAYLIMQLVTQPNSWSTWIPFWCFVYNNTVHSETKYAPYELVFTKNCRLPSNVLNDVDVLYNFDDYPFELKYRMQVALKEARNNLIKSKVNRTEKLNSTG